jgi:putative chitinase
MITTAQLREILTLCREPITWAAEFNASLPVYGILTKDQLAHFIGQVAVESQQLNRLTENLNYSAEGLMATWPNRFPSLVFAQQYARNPEKIANFVYANRLGNGPPESGDGWRYRGHSLIQTTGKTNINRALSALGLPLNDPAPLATPKYACKAAGLYWSERGCNALVGDVVALTKAINGGTHGLQMRQAFTKRALEVL